PAVGRVEGDRVAVPLHPDDGALRGAVGAQRRDDAEVLLVEKGQLAFGQRTSHVCATVSPPCPPAPERLSGWTGPWLPSGVSLPSSGTRRADRPRRSNSSSAATGPARTERRSSSSATRPPRRTSPRSRSSPRCAHSTGSTG